MVVSKLDRVYKVLESINDPEIPVLSIVDLGILREAKMLSDDHVEVTITPTYTGCPAMDSIADDITNALRDAGFECTISMSISPAWTTDWMSLEGKKKLEAYGIAPPVEITSDKSFLSGNTKAVPCPRCKDRNTKMISRFGSTACKSLYQCKECCETFDYFKCI